MSTAALPFQGMPKGHLVLECETKIHMPDITFAFLFGWRLPVHMVLAQ